MTMQNEPPEWAMEEAAALRSAVVWQSNASNEVIARALVAAERRGIERAAKVADEHSFGRRQQMSDAGAQNQRREARDFESMMMEGSSIADAIRQIGGKGC